jgi:hypothetical protein
LRNSCAFRLFAVIAICSNYDNNAVTFCRCASKRATHGQAFIIGVSVKRDNRAH